MRIGLVGEAPNDTSSIKSLLLKKYSNDHFIFFSMINNITGSQLDSQKTKRFLRIEYENLKPDIIIFIRDLDSLLSNRKQLFKRKDYFTEFNRVVDKKGVYLLHVYEIEALILADIEKFNNLYGTNIASPENVMLISEPKEVLKSASNKYSESHNGEIFEHISIEKVMSCKYFNLFIKKLDKLLLQ